MNRRSFLQTVSGVVVSAGVPGEAQAHASSSDIEARPAPIIEGSVRIGNFHAFSPGGIAFLKDQQFGIVLNVGWDKTGRPGVAAPDHSINIIEYVHSGANVNFLWAKAGQESVVACLKVDKTTTLDLTIPARPWAAFNNAISKRKSNQTLEVTGISGTGDLMTWRFEADSTFELIPQEPSAYAKLSFSLSPDKSLYFVAGFGQLPTLPSADAVLKNAADSYTQTRAASQGGWGDFVGAIAQNINNSQLYSSLSKSVATVIGRDQWIVTDPDFLPYFAWDTSFNALLASLESPQQAHETIRTMLVYQLEDGMMPQISNWNHDPLPYVNIRGSNPPVTSLCVWNIHERWPNREFLAEVYPRLLRWHDWWPAYSDGNKNGLLEWGALGTFQDARLMCGWDDTPAFDGATKIGTQMNADAVDLNSLWSMDAEYLARIADELGFSSDASRLREEHEQMNERINKHLWNEELGMYCHRLWDEDGQPGKFLTRITPMNFYPLICGAPDMTRAARVIRTLTAPQKFWGEWLIPTLAYDDPDWHVQDYWKGHTWAPVNYLVWQGVKRYCTREQQFQFVERSVNLFMKNWNERGTCNEAYLSSTGVGDRYPHYTWGALLCQIGLEYICKANHKGQLDKREVSLNLPSMELRNIPSGGKRYRLVYRGNDFHISPELYE